MNILKKYTIEVTPLDTLFFRGGMPFSMGEDSWTQTSILPNPSVIWGALFSTLCVNGLANKSQEADRQKLMLKRFFLCDKENFNLYLPTPLDLCQLKEVSNKYYYFKQSNDIISNYPLDKMFSPTYSGVKELNGVENTFIKISDLSDGYFRKDSNLTIISGDDFQVVDDKVGIKRDRLSGASEESKLYNAKFTQLKKNWCFIVEFECLLEFPQNGVIRLGGEGKMASFKKCDEDDWILEDINDFDKKNKEKLDKTNHNIIKLYFSSPAFLEEGSLLNNKIFELHGAFIGKPVSIGGFDMLSNSPKKMLKGIPQGSIYYLKNNRNLSIIEINECIKQYLKPLNERGFGTFEILAIKK